MWYKETIYIFCSDYSWSVNYKHIFTARKRSLGQGYIFTPVFLFTAEQYLGRYPPPPDQVHPPGSGTPPNQVPSLGPGTPPEPGALPGTRCTPRAVHGGRYGQQAGGTHPTGMHSCVIYVGINEFEKSIVTFKQDL